MQKMVIHISLQVYVGMYQKKCLVDIVCHLNSNMDYVSKLTTYVQALHTYRCTGCGINIDYCRLLCLVVIHT